MEVNRHFFLVWDKKDKIVKFFNGKNWFWTLQEKMCYHKRKYFSLWLYVSNYETLWSRGIISEYGSVKGLKFYKNQNCNLVKVPVVKWMQRLILLAVSFTAIRQAPTLQFKVTSTVDGISMLISLSSSSSSVPLSEFSLSSLLSICSSIESLFSASLVAWR